MTAHKSKAHGVPNWAICFTPDLAATEAFYSDVFGWASERSTRPDGSTYAVQSLDGQAVAGIWGMNETQRAAGVPAHWATYFEVDDVDALTAKVETAGGALVESIRSETGLGRIAIIHDPEGAQLRLWTSQPEAGADIFNVEGAMTWNELMTGNVDRAIQFYETVLGLAHERVPTGDASYIILKAEDRPAAGLLPKTAAMADAPGASWDVYFASSDVDEAVARVRGAGGAVLAGPFDVPGGSARMAVVRDSMGAVFEVIKMQEPSG